MTATAGFDDNILREVPIDDDILREVSIDDVLALKELYKSNWPKHIITYYHLKIVCGWKRDFDHNIKFYCPEGRWDDGTIVTISRTQSGIYITCFTLEKSNERLRRAFSETKRIEWDLNPLFCIVHKDQYAAVLDALNANGLVVRMVSPGVYRWLPAAQALKLDFEMPPGMYIGPIDESHIPEINDVWPHKHLGSDVYLTSLVKFNYGLGLFMKETNELCAWAMKNDYGMLAILQTAEKHKRKGFGTMITKAVSKKMAEEGMDIVVCVMVYNTASQKMFKKMGFEIVDYTCWLHTDSK